MVSALYSSQEQCELKSGYFAWVLIYLPQGTVLYPILRKIWCCCFCLPTSLTIASG